MGLGFVAMLIGTGIFLTGQFLDTRDKQKAKRFFLLPGAWILLFIPIAFCFNTLMGLKGGGLSWWIAPIPMLVHSFKAWGLYWVIYISQVKGLPVSLPTALNLVLLRIILRLCVPQLVVFALCISYERSVSPLLDDRPFVEYGDLVTEFTLDNPQK